MLQPETITAALLTGVYFTPDVVHIIRVAARRTGRIPACENRKDSMGYTAAAQVLLGQAHWFRFATLLSAVQSANIVNS